MLGLPQLEELQGESSQQVREELLGWWPQHRQLGFVLLAGKQMLCKIHLEGAVLIADGYQGHLCTQASTYCCWHWSAEKEASLAGTGAWHWLEAIRGC